MGYKVFLSHSSRDTDLGRLVKTEVEATGKASVYLAEDDIQLGSVLAAKLQRELKASDAIVVLYTKDSEVSAYVNQEIGFALRDKLVIPMVEKRSDTRRLGMLAGREFVSFDSENPGQAVQTLAQFVQRKAAEQDMKELVGILILVGFVAIMALSDDWGRASV